MIGIDITDISRFENKEKKFVKRILHSDEIKEYLFAKNKAKFLATRWAIKESLFKADNKLSSYSKVNIKKLNNSYTYSGFEISTTTEGKNLIAIAFKKEEK